MELTKEELSLKGIFFAMSGRKLQSVWSVKTDNKLNFQCSTGQHDENFVLLHTFQPIAIQHDGEHCQAVLSLVEILVEGQNFCCAVMHKRETKWSVRNSLVKAQEYSKMST